MKNLAELHHFKFVSFESKDIDFNENQYTESLKIYGEINSTVTLNLNLNFLLAHFFSKQFIWKSLYIIILNVTCTFLNALRYMKLFLDWLLLLQ